MSYQTNTALLKSKMVLSGLNAKTLSEELGLSEFQTSKKIHGKAEWKQSEILYLVKRLDLTPEETKIIFLTRG